MATFSRAELVVFGFIRTIMDIPKDLMKTCLEFYNDNGDYFEEAEYRLKLSNAQSTITKSMEISSWTFSKAIIKHIVMGSNTGITTWHFHLDECVDGGYNINFLLSACCLNSKEQRWKDVNFAFIGYDRDHQDTFHKGDDVQIILDLFQLKLIYKINNNPARLIRKLAISINDHHSLISNYKYKLCVELYNPNDTVTIKQISYSTVSVRKHKFVTKY